LELVWTNLLLNSLQHGGPTPRIEVGWKHLETETCFWLRDSGPGVAVAKRARLFHPIDRLNELNAPRGYGLSLVQRLVELQSGTTGYHPDPAPGGSFYFTLPTNESSPAAAV
jgi:K+-sensing histidine kinase KdpD